MKSCLCLALEALGHEIITVEGLQNTSLQMAFADLFAMQCGYCTPSFVMNAYTMLIIQKDPDDDVIDAWMPSNICRCTYYEEISTAMRGIIKKDSCGPITE